MKPGKIKKTLIDQLSAKNADIDVFKDLIDDYMQFWEITKSLQSEIKERGTIIEEYNTVGALVRKCNPAIKELRDTNKQMLALLKQLNLNSDNVVTEVEDNEL